MTNEVKCWCQHCGQELEPSHTGKCPYCGETGKRCEATASLAIGLKVSATVEGPKVYFIWFKKKLAQSLGFILIDIALLLVTTSVAYVASVLGQCLGTLVGFAVGLVIIIIFDLYFRKKIENTKRKVMERL
jgi:predicted RNA-binding Zn-ribbon protein involved in translation (DUF1610 family)